MQIMSKESVVLNEQQKSLSQNEQYAMIMQEYRKTTEYLSSSYDKSELRNDHEFVCSECTPLSGKDILVMQPWVYQFNLLAARNFKQNLRLPQTSVLKFITTVVIAVFASLLFWQAGAYIPIGSLPNVYSVNFNNVRGALFFLTMNISFNAI